MSSGRPSPHDGDDDRRERLVDLDPLGIAEFPARTVQRQLDGRDRAKTEHPRRDRSDAVGLLHARQKLLRLKQRQRQIGDIAEVAAPAGLHHSIPRAGLSVSVSPNRNTHPIHDPQPATVPAGHIASFLVPPVSGHSCCKMRQLAQQESHSPS